MADGDAEDLRGRGPLDRPLDRRRAATASTSTPTPAPRSTAASRLETERTDRAVRGDPQPGGDLRRRGRPDDLLLLLGRPHRVRLPRRPGGPLPARASPIPTTTTRRCTAGRSASRRPRWTLGSAPTSTAACAGLTVTKRGDSPRIDYARLIGTGGASTIRGDTLAAALGLYDRWAFFTKAEMRQSSLSAIASGRELGNASSRASAISLPRAA